MIDEAAFTHEFATLSTFFERRRRKYLAFFYAGIALGTLLVASAICIPGQAMHLISVLFFVHRPVSQSDIVAYRIFVACLCVILVVRPVHYYRSLRFTPLLHAGQSTDFSLKDAGYTRMFALFGQYEFAPKSSIPFDSIRQSLLCGSHPIYSARDCVSGKSHDVGVKLCDVTITHPTGQSAPPSFRGVLIVCDISQMQVKLRLPFNGRMVLAESAICDGVAGRPAKKLPLPGALADRYTAYSNNMLEAQRIVTAPLAALLQDFSQAAAGFAPQKRHIDDTITDAMLRLREYVKDKAISVLGKTELAAEKAYSDAYGNVPDSSLGLSAAAGPVSKESVALEQKSFALEYYGDKCIAFIPCVRNLMESKSLFEPVMAADSARFIYAAMQCADRLSNHLNTVMP